MRFEILDFLGTVVNYFIFVYIFFNTMNTSCFDTSDMGIALVGLISSVFILVVNISRRNRE